MHVSPAARVVALALAFVARAALPQTGTVTGRVTDKLTGAPLTAAYVSVTGTPLTAAVDAYGRFRIVNVPSSAREVRARSIGYAPIAVAFSLAPDGIATVTLAMTISHIELDAVAVTGSVGDTRLRALGSSVEVLNASEVVARSAVDNVTELLQAKIPGLTILPASGTVGTAASFRLRGSGSLYGNNSPTIYVDGLRVISQSQGNYNVFGQATTALDAINPADIESVEVIRGPSAATLYGAEAAPGVIQILTKRGRAGRVKWDSRIETGWSDWDKNLRPVNFAVATPERIADTSNWPGFEGKSAGDIISFRPLSDGRALRTASLSKQVLSASGGGDRYTFFVSAGKSDEEGVFFNNFSNLRSFRGNFTFLPTNKLTFTTNVALSHNHVRLPLNDNAGPMGLINSSYLAVPGRAYPFPGGQNYSAITPEDANTYDNQTRADRYTIGLSAEYTPVSWFRNKLRVGLDANAGQAELYFAPDSRIPAAFVPRVSLFGDNSKGLIAEGRPMNRDITLNYDGTLTRQLSNTVVSNTSVGMQYLSNQFRRTDAIGVDLGSVGLRSVSSAAIRSSADTSSEQKSAGFYGQEQVSLEDRLFVTLAMRIDNNSAFGSKLNRVAYPKASISYVMSDAPYFRVPGISALRLRAAWGQAGNAPGPFDAVRSYSSSVVTYSNGTSSALRYSSVGNPNLRPERSSEIEAGFESSFLDDRVGLDASYYHKTTRDALMSVPVAPSTGFQGFQFRNLGEISNTGIEMQLTATPVHRKSLTVDVSLSLATNSNKLVAFGYETGPILFGFSSQSSQQYQEGYPLGGMWARRMQRNPDGSLLKVGGVPVVDTASVYMGPSVPTREMSLSGGVLLFGRLRIYGLLDYKAGHYQFNVKDWRRDQANVSWETVNPAADPDEVLERTSASQTFLRIEPADFVKLRDVSISYDLPPQFLHGIAQRATLTVAGHNLKIWTRYGGADPEVNFSGAAVLNRDDSWVVPQTRRYSAAIALRF
jgi:TonB-linked SusC/RagA family outer membrane protein